MSPREIDPVTSGNFSRYVTEEELQQELMEEEEAEARGDFSHVGFGALPYRILKGLRDGTIKNYRVTHVETVADLIARLEREEKEELERKEAKEE